jgi:hypothetical protein
MIWKKVWNPHLDPFTTYHNMNFQHFENTLMKGFIWHSKSLTSASIMFVKKKDVSLQMCVNYHGESTYHQKLILATLISRLLDQFSHAKMYSKIALCGAYNLVCIWKGDEWRTIFCTRYDHFMYVVMPFGFMNALVVFQHLMNDDFREYLSFMVCYIDDIFICSKNFEKHEQHVWFVLDKLKEVGLYAKLEKCEFH